LAALSLIWGYHWVVMKECLRFISPADFAAWRTVSGALGLFALLLLQGKTLRPREMRYTLAILSFHGFLQARRGVPAR
jgi:drug/metabolite transporter (DMT)-like permease